ncbi:MAG: hypothetical protein ACKOCX_01775 [Planctomycetota bacterium]
MAAEALPPPAPAAPLPDAPWTDPESVNWVDPPAETPTARPAGPPRLRERFADRRFESRPTLGVAERLRGRLRGEGRLARALTAAPEGHGSDAPTSDSGGWPTPGSLLDQLEPLASSATGPESAWAEQTLATLEATLQTLGPADPAAAGPLLALGEAVAAGMVAADSCASPQTASQTRRAALAVARRVAVWRAAAAWCSAERSRLGSTATARDVAVMLGVNPADAEIGRLLAVIERYEAGGEPLDAAAVKAALAGAAATPSPAAAELVRAVFDHYHAANVRIAVHRSFVERMLPESTVNSGGFQDFILGRPVRGRRTVEQTASVRFVPHVGEIRMELIVSGQIAARSVTESGPVTVHSTSQSTFTVAKPVHLTTTGLALGQARGTARSRAQLADIETSFDSVPIMGSLVRSIARSQHDEAKAEANREASGKIVGRACREVDQQAGPKLEEMAERIRERLWQPLVNLGLEPTPVALETTADVASLRLRLAADNQLAAHTPRPRAPGDALVSMQLHETVANNALGRFGLAGQRFELPALARLVCERLGIEPRLPDDLPDGVAVTFAGGEPLRVECRDGLVHVRVALDAIESGRRNWYDLVARVAYKPVVAGPQVYLEREGPVRIGGPDHEGRMEIALRTIFGKIFAKERLIPIVPAKVTENPKLAAMRAVQAVATDGWLGIALADPTATAPARAATPSPTAVKPATTDLGPLRR